MFLWVFGRLRLRICGFRNARDGRALRNLNRPMQTIAFRSALLLAGASLALSSATAQSRYATSVVSFHQGGGSGVFDQNLILGGPRGGAGSHVLTLGSGGDVTLGFDVTITNGPGADFVVFENGFEFNGQIYPEMAMVEVSTNGVDFARFPIRYDGPQGPFASVFELLDWGVYSGLTGAIPPLANVDTNTLDPFNPVEGGGEAFDLDDLSDHPLVHSSLVDLNQIHYVRLVDLVAGQELDFRLVPVWDSGGPDGNADIDAVAVIHDTTSVLPNAPTVNFWRDDLGYVWLEISDPDGIGTIDWPNVGMTANNQPSPFYRLRNFFVLAASDANGITLRSPLPMYLQDFKMVLSLSASDLDGNTSVDQISLNR